jgi:hypothetical protein
MQEKENVLANTVSTIDPEEPSLFRSRGFGFAATGNSEADLPGLWVNSGLR